MICPYCHKNTPPNRDRCIYCGTTLNETRAILPPGAEPLGAEPLGAEPLGQNTVSSPSSPMYGPEDSGAPAYDPAGGGSTPDYNNARGEAPAYNPSRGGASEYNPSRGGAPDYNNAKGEAPSYNPSRGGAPGYGAGGSGMPSGYNTARGGAPEYNPSKGGAPGYNNARGEAPSYNPSRGGAPGYGAGGSGMPPGYNTARGGTPGYNPSSGGAPGYNPARGGAPGYNNARGEAPGYNPSSGGAPAYGAGGGMPPGYRPPGGSGGNPGYNPGAGGGNSGYSPGAGGGNSGYSPGAGGGSYGYNQAGGGRAPGYGAGGGMPPGYRPPGGGMPPNYDMDSGRLRSILLGWAPFLVLGLLLIVIVILFIVDPLHDSSEESSESSTTGETAEEGVDPEHAMVNGQNIPPDAIEIGGNYYYVFTGLGLSSRAAAEQYCEDRGGHLAVITSQELNDRLYQLCLDSGVETAIFGYSDEKIEGNWEWVTDAQPGYTNWGRTEPNGAADGEDYAIFSSSEANGRWNDTQFGHETTDFICQWNDNGIVDEPIQVRIPDDAVKFDGHHYYLFDNGKSNWCEAQNFCKSVGGDLVVVNNGDENQFLMDYIEDMGYDRAFIGYSDEESEGRWYWVSGKTSHYVDWGITRDGDVAPTNETRWYNFAEIDLQLTAGSWKDGVFGQDTTAYICEWE